MRPIINAHTHLLSFFDIPKGFPNRTLGAIANTKAGYAVIKGLLRNINPFSSKDAMDKLLTFIKASRIGSEGDLFEKLSSYYPSDTKYVALTMNMHHMGAGRCRRPYLDSLLSLDALKTRRSNILPFYMADCRDENVNTFFDKFVLKRGWSGVKFYPPLGTFPQDVGYNYILDQCERKQIPVLSHCTFGNPVHWKGSKKKLKKLLAASALARNQYDAGLSKKENCSKFTDPRNWAQVAKRFPSLKICLAHAGGSEAWAEWVKQPSNPDNLLNMIIDVMRTHHNVYMDISFTAGHEFAADVLYTLMTEPKFSFLQDRILFGSDWYMSLSETTEAEWSIGLKRRVGVAIFDKIARENTHKFLGI